MLHTTLIELFNQQFQISENTVLIDGATEPLYKPAQSPREQHCIYFSHDYAASALHEIAHWTLAGSERRLQIDYGYWYAPDGRSPEQQRLFEQVEVKPQAVEWIFSLAAGLKFKLSADNLDSNLGASEAFKAAVWQQAYDYLEQASLPPRAAQFVACILQHCASEKTLDSSLLDCSCI